MKRAGDYPMVTGKEGVQTYGTFTPIAPPLDKPAALLALMSVYSSVYSSSIPLPHLETGLVNAIEKLAEQIIAEVEEGK
jgi:hypothetical protein